MSTTGKAESYIELKGSLSLPGSIKGKSAYEIAVSRGFDGTEEEWLLHLERAQAEEVEEAAEQAKTDISEAKKKMLSEIELAAEIVQTSGDSETAVMSQKAVTEKIDEIWELVESANLFNKDSEDNVYGYILEVSSNKETAIANYAYSHFIEVEEGATYYYYNWKGYLALSYVPNFYDASGVYIRTTPQQQEAAKEGEWVRFTVPAGLGIVKMRVSYCTKDGVDSQMMVVKSDTAPTRYIPYSIEPKLSDNMTKAVEKEVNPLYGKIISFNGDSICEARATNGGGYATIIGANNNMTVENLGVSGATIMYAEGTGKHCISRTVANMREDADYIILEGGVNDLYSDRQLGTMSSGYNATLDDTTFYGAFENMLKQALIRFPGKKIGYIAVHKMTQFFDSDKAEDNAYHAAIKCCAKWGVPVLDLNKTVPPFAYLKNNPNTAFMANLYTEDTSKTGVGDGWHPNEEGYKKYYVPKIEAWLKTL